MRRRNMPANKVIIESPINGTIFKPKAVLSISNNETRIRSPLAWRKLAQDWNPKSMACPLSQHRNPKLPRPANTSSIFQSFKKQAEEGTKLENILDAERDRQNEQHDKERMKLEETKQR